jgi:hypothetical protein
MRFHLRPKHYSVAIRGVASGRLSPPLTFLTFRTAEQAQAWITTTEVAHARSETWTHYEVVDLRTLG